MKRHNFNLFHPENVRCTAQKNIQFRRNVAAWIHSRWVYTNVTESFLTNGWSTQPRGLNTTIHLP